MRPFVGETVHYVSHGTPVRDDGTQAFTPQCRAAIIAAVPKYLLEEPMDGCPNGTDGEWLADLAVFNPTGLFFQQNLKLDQHLPGDGGTWHYQEDCGS